jgi:hypothetical protein
VLGLYTRYLVRAWMSAPAGVYGSEISCLVAMIFVGGEEEEKQGIERGHTHNK